MNLSTKTVPTIELTEVEEEDLWDTPPDERVVLGKKVFHWDSCGGNNIMLLEGETMYRELVTIPDKT